MAVPVLTFIVWIKHRYSKWGILTLWSKISRIFFVITGITFFLVIALEVLVFFASPTYLNHSLGFSILLDWASSSPTDWNYLILIYLGLICSILGMLTAILIGYDLRKSHGLKTLAIIIPSIIGFSLAFYSFFTLFRIPFEMAPHFDQNTPAPAIPGIMAAADGIVYGSILLFSIGLVLVLPIVNGFLFVSERTSSTSKYVNDLLGISAVVSSIAIIAAMLLFMSIPIYTAIWALMTFIPLVLFSIWLIVQGVKGGTSIDSEPPDLTSSTDQE
jgi:hypothetical protein